MKLKTISGHYDKVYCLEHNNRLFLPENVDPRRFSWNYYCIAAGQVAELNLDVPVDLQALWEGYHKLNDIYYSNRSIYQTILSDEYIRIRNSIRQYRQAYAMLSHNPIAELLALLIFPFLIPCQIYLHHRNRLALKELETLKQEQWLRDLAYKASKISLRDALMIHDIENGTTYLHTLDTTVSEIAQLSEDYMHISFQTDLRPKEHFRYATLEEIYGKLYEPSFQQFQQKQRPCRRYHGTYLEQIREQQAKNIKKRQQTKNVKSRSTSEAIEIVFGIGDMDNTGYDAVFSDAKKSEELLKDFCDHLIMQPNICFVTTKELADPTWQPPFQHGLILLNLTMHADEATPGIHMTCIPYSRNCKRGPSVQASLGRTMAGMGYPSTWKDALDENRERIPKRNKNGDIIYNKDGSVRYQQEPEKQGILDWIEDQKRWIQWEMKQRYDWDREYKGSHPRGNLSTPDYKAARAKERQEIYTKSLEQSISTYKKRISELSAQLDHQIDNKWKNATNQDIIERYLSVCPDDDYYAILNTASSYLDSLSCREETKIKQDLAIQIQKAHAAVQKNHIKASKPVISHKKP